MPNRIILFVLLAQILQAERFVGEEHTLFVGQFAADLDFRVHALFVDIGNCGTRAVRC